MPVTDEHALLLQISANVTGIEKSLKHAAQVVKEQSQEMEKSATHLEKWFGRPELSKALDKTFDASKFKVLEAGAEQVGVFGGALEALGPAGFIAAGAIGALAGALEGAKQAAEFAHDIETTAKRLHVTTDALQEYRYAIRMAGGEEKGADDALEAFSVTLGKAQEGLTRSKKGFLALGFTVEQINSFKTADEALQAVTEKIAGLGSNVQKDAVIEQLGLTGLKPLIEGGVDSMRKLREESHAAGVVMDNGLVKQGSAMNEQIKTLTDKIHNDLSSALIGIGPILVGLIKLVASLIDGMSHIIDSFQSIENKRTDSLQARKSLLEGMLTQPQGHGRSAQVQSPEFIKSTQDEIRQIDAILASRAKKMAEEIAIPRGISVADMSTGGGGGRSRTPKPTKEDVIKSMAVFDQEYSDLWDLLNYNKKVIEDQNNTHAKIDTNVANLTTNADMQQQIVDSMEATRKSTHDAIYDGVLGGLEAGFQGGVPAMAAYLKDQVLRGLMNAIAEALTSNIMAAAGGKGGGGFVGTALSLFGFAGGTNYAPGGIAVVGEHGPEIVNLPRGSRVVPNNLASTIHQVGQSRGQGGTVVQHFHLDATGAVMTEDLIHYINQMGSQAASVGAQQGSAMAVKQIYTRARNKLGR